MRKELTDAGRIAASIGLGIFPEKCSDEQALRWLAEKEESYGHKEALRDLGALEALLGGINGPSIKLRAFLERRALAAMAPPAVSSLTDARIVEIRDEHLPNQGDRFDCIAFAFARAILRAAKTGSTEK